MGTEDGVEGIIKEEEVDTIEVAIDLSGIEGILGVLDEVGHVPGVQKEDPFLLKDPEADPVDHTDPLGLQDHHHLVLHPHIANLLSLKDEGLRKNKPKKLKGNPKKRVL
ncbi:hypothetical protein I79_025470 [Cricetulus griseus]|uniref:Uncharacterized protein n=1 Tax=Cricetulus griseus TaxID=10029 RepID=G3GW67_CRIGR|nr:hypothetical protein I79_001983 [Cricetulus griseus]EGW14872.1 hypothetical protein I79_025470 [Cricetulus griseus]